MRRTLGGFVAAGALLALAPSALADSPSSTQTHDCGMGNTITFSGSPVLWPPNHKYRTYDIVAKSSIPMDMVSLTSTVSNDEVINGEELNGAGNTADDVKPNPGKRLGHRQRRGGPAGARRALGPRRRPRVHVPRDGDVRHGLDALQRRLHRDRAARPGTPLDRGGGRGRCAPPA